MLSTGETQLQIKWICTSRGDDVYINEVNSGNMHYRPVLQIMHLESSDMGKKSSNLVDINLECCLLSNTLDRVRETASLSSI